MLVQLILLGGLRIQEFLNLRREFAEKRSSLLLDSSDSRGYEGVDFTFLLFIQTRPYEGDEEN